VFLVASGRDDIDPCEILFERNSVCGDTSAGSAPWQKATRIAGAGTAATGSDAGLNPYGKVAMTFGFGGGTGPVDVAVCLMAAGAKHDICTENFLLQSVVAPLSHALNAATYGKVYREGSANNGIPMIAGSLLSNSGNPGRNQNLPTVFGIALRGSDKSHALTQNREAHFHYTPLKPDRQHWPQWKVRRLMPVECERLQGMPDGWTQVPYRGKPAADTPRYKAIGNSMAVPCVAWLGQRLLQALQPSKL
jgi:DNA (cytosine-5)-methyltransferase 1